MSEAYKNYVTPVGRASFLNIQEKQEQLNGDLKFTGSICFSKENEEDLKDVRRHIRQAIVAKWGKDKAKWPKGLDIPLRDGDQKADEAKERGKNLENYRGHFYMNCKTDYQPGVVGPNGKPLMNLDDLYAGCYVRYNVSFYAYQKGGNAGVGVGLQNIMLVKQSEERWDAKVSAEQAFAAYAEESSDEEEDMESEAESNGQEEDDLEDFD